MYMYFWYRRRLRSHALSRAPKRDIIHRISGDIEIIIINLFADDFEIGVMIAWHLWVTQVLRQVVIGDIIMRIINDIELLALKILINKCHKY